MNELSGEKQCPKCGYHVDSPQISPYLPLKTPLGGKYIIGKAVSSNGESITYSAYDVDRKTAVVIKEFLPERLVNRADDGKTVAIVKNSQDIYYDLLNKFLDLWRNLARVRGFSALIPVIDIIEENNTAYAVTEYIESLSLREFLLRSKTGYLNWEKAKVLFMPVLSLLSNLHKSGIVHYGISPDTLLIGRDGKLRLSGFSIPEERFERTQIPAELFDGYTPLEQYGYDLESGEWSDVYSFCATVYRALVGSVPQNAISRSTSDKLIIPARYAEIIPVYVINALMNGLQVDPLERTKDIESLREELSATPSNVVSSYSGIKMPSEDKKDAPVYVTSDEESPAQIILKTFLIILGVGLIGFAGWLVYDKVINAPEETPVEENTQVVETVEVPNFVNSSYDLIAQNPVQNDRFTIKSVSEYSTTVEKGYIISQSIAPGKTVEKGTEIVFVISKGPEYVLIPPVVDFEADLAKEQLENAGFVVKVIEKVNDGDYTANTVASVTPEAGSSQVKGSEVYLEVWGEPPANDGGFDWFNDDSANNGGVTPGINFGDLFGDLF
jgi:serine/threonine-protein kinase